MPTIGIAPLELAAGKLSACWRLLRRFLNSVPALGFVAAAIVLLCEASTRRPIAQIVKSLPIERVKVKPAGYSHPISFRRVGSDVAVLSQILVTREYEPVSSLRSVRLIVDCGANIGVSAYYFLHCYPEARLIAVEPDAANCALCRQNLKPFAKRAVVVQAAVWPENRRLQIVPASRRKGNWSLEVEPSESGDVEGLTIPEILHRGDAHGPIDLLKVDIEGAETEVFRGSPSWLALTRNIAIELHHALAEETVTRAIAGYQYERRQAHELTIIYGLRPIENLMKSRS